MSRVTPQVTRARPPEDCPPPLTVVLASPVFAASTSENNQFRAIAALAPRIPEPPICCLQPLQPLEEKEEEVLLSFEEWKSKQSQLEKSKGKDSDNKSAQANGGSTGGTRNGGENLTEVVNASNAEEVPIHDEMPKAQPPEVEVLSPHFRVPLRGRFNYANSDCSARVHMSHRSAKSSSAILSSKRDRYMLSPCVSPGEPHFVVVELCDDIAIDTVQLANFEFFSGVFKDFKVSVTKTDFTKPAHEWTDAGTYRAKNVRGVQSFPLPNTLRDFYRYIRIDFLSHYGSEYYCPVSLLRVYGLTHLEQWKWDEWAAQSHPETVQPVAEILPSTPVEESSADITSTASQEQPIAQDQHTKGRTRANDDTHTVADAAQSAIASTDAEPIPVAQKSTEAEAPVVTSAQPKDTPPLTSAQSTRVDPTTPSAHDTHSSITDSRIHTTETAASPSITSATPPPVNSAAASSSSSPDSSSVSHSKSLRSRSHTTSVVASSATPIIISAGASAVSHPPTGGESIYRTIMNRITALENNHTLYALYLGEQMDGVREKLRRLGEDVGRLEGIGRGQAQAYHRTLEQWEKQQSQMQNDFRELLSKVENLSGEIVWEKRLGIAQLCLLLAVLVFMGLTRGSRERVQVAPQNNTAKWRRNLKLSGDWARGLVRSRTRSGDSAVTDTTPSQRSSVDYDRPEAPPRSAEQIELQAMRNDSPSHSNFPFPDKSSPKRRPLQTNDMNSRQERHHHHVVFPVHHDHYSVKSRSRTPSRRVRGHTGQANTIYSQNQVPPVTPTHPVPHTAVYSTGYARPRMQRSNSHGASASLGGITSSGHRSGKRLGRVAHLHVISGRDAERKAKRRTGGQREGTETDEDVFGSAAAKKHSALGLYERKSRHYEGANGARPDSSSSVDIQTPSEDSGSPTSLGKDTDWVDTDTEVGFDV